MVFICVCLLQSQTISSYFSRDINFPISNKERSNSNSIQEFGCFCWLTSDRINSLEPSGIVSLFADVLVISGMRAGDSNHYHPPLPVCHPVSQTSTRTNLYTGNCGFVVCSASHNLTHHHSDNLSISSNN